MPQPWKGPTALQLLECSADACRSKEGFLRTMLQGKRVLAFASPVISEAAAMLWIGTLGQHVETVRGARLYQYFWETWQSLKHAIGDEPVDFFTGWGLGGSLAMLAAWDLAPHDASVVTFGQAMVGEKGWDRHYGPDLAALTHRFVHGRDPVVDWPPALSMLHPMNAHAGICHELGERPKPPLPSPLRVDIAEEYARLTQAVHDGSDVPCLTVVQDHIPLRYRDSLLAANI
jgi:hypothetical protein